MTYPQVSVYWNLHKKCYSIKNSVGIVQHHARSVWLADVTFRVQQGGRQRVIKEGRKNVHAFIAGKLLAHSKDDGDRVFTQLDYHFDMSGSSTVTYNPYKNRYFLAEDVVRVDEAESALLMTLMGKSFVRVEDD